MTAAAAAEPSTPAVDPNVVAGAASTDEAFDYEAEFNAQVAKREAERAEAAGDDEPEVLKPEPEESTEEPATTEAQPAAEAPAEPAKEPAADDLLAQVPQSVRDALAAQLQAGREAVEKARKLENDNRSLAGRMSAYQKRYEIAAGKRPAEPVKTATAEELQEWTKFQTDYPEIAKAIEAKFKAEQSASPHTEVTQDVVQYVQEKKREQFLEDAWAAVDTVHPGWRDKARTPEFQAWKKSSPTYEKLAASDDTSDAIALFDLYAAQHPTAQTPAAPAAQPADSGAATLAARRAAQAEGARAPSGRSAAPNTDVDLNSEDSLFAFYASKANERIRRRNA